MNDDNTQGAAEPSLASGGSLPAALAEYKRLAKICGVDEGIDLPVVAMAFFHGAAYGAKQPTLTDAEQEALRFFLARWGDEANTRHADALHALLERTK